MGVVAHRTAAIDIVIELGHHEQAKGVDHGIKAQRVARGNVNEREEHDKHRRAEDGARREHAVLDHNVRDFVVLAVAPQTLSHFVNQQQ